MPLFSRLCFLSQGNSSVVEELPSLHLLHRSPTWEVASPPTIDSDVVSFSQHFGQTARGPSSISIVGSPYPCLNSEDVKLIDSHPVSAGGYADVWKAMYDGRVVALKSYRCYEMFDAVHTIKVYHNHGLYKVVHY